MAEKSTISFVTIVVPLLVFRNSQLPLTDPLICLCNCIRFVVEVSTMEDGLPDLLDDACCDSPSGLCVDSTTRVRSTSFLLPSGVKSSSWLGARPGIVSEGPGPDVIVTIFLTLLPFSSDVIRLRLLFSRIYSFPSVGSPSMMYRSESFNSVRVEA
jgi:hypothetical protein